MNYPSAIESPAIEIATPATQRRWAIAFGLYTAATSLTFTQGVWVVYLALHGFSPFEIGLFETCFHVAKFLAEAPTGVFADLVGRRVSLVISALLVVVAELLFLAPTPTLIALCFAMQGVAYAFRGGADSALLWTLVERSGDEKRAARYSRLFSRMFVVMLLTQTAGVATGGFLLGYGQALPFIFTSLTSALAIIPLLALPEHRVHAAQRNRPLAHLREGVRAVWRDPALLGLLLLSALTAGVITTIGYYTQLYYHSIGFSLATIGLLLAIPVVPDALFAAAAPRIMRWLPRRWLLAVFVGAELLGLLGLATRVPALALVGYLGLLHVGDSVLYPAISTYLNERSPEAQRATILSLETGLFSAIMIVLFPLFGFGLTRIDFSQAYLWTFVALLLGSVGIVALVWGLRQRSRH
ncbi:MAG TPA: MFS transporter [Ktedonobacterales bacterium]|nr:MFS transporter [Ktedonobacterales bacterium]